MCGGAADHNPHIVIEKSCSTYVLYNVLQLFLAGKMAQCEGIYRSCETSVFDGMMKLGTVIMIHVHQQIDKIYHRQPQRENSDDVAGTVDDGGE